MASVLQQYHQLADRMATQITGSYQSWTDFLTTAARLYKYPYHEQLMIYAQHPEATACADYELWNKRMCFQMYHPQKLIRPLEEYTLPRREYASDLAELPAAKGFITEDEINAHLIGGSNFSGSKSRIYAFYQAPHTTKEKLDFLKNEYGIWSSIQKNCGNSLM